jgi:hypothetical protein
MEFSQTAFFASTNKYLDELLDESWSKMPPLHRKESGWSGGQ